MVHDGLHAAECHRASARCRAGLLRGGRATMSEENTTTSDGLTRLPGNSPTRYAPIGSRFGAKPKSLSFDADAAPRSRRNEPAPASGQPTNEPAPANEPPPPPPPPPAAGRAAAAAAATVDDARRVVRRAGPAAPPGGRRRLQGGLARGRRRWVRRAARGHSLAVQFVGAVERLLGHDSSRRSSASSGDVCFGTVWRRLPSCRAALASRRSRTSSRSR